MKIDHAKFEKTLARALEPFHWPFEEQHMTAIGQVEDVQIQLLITRRNRMAMYPEDVCIKD